MSIDPLPAAGLAHDHLNLDEPPREDAPEPAGAEDNGEDAGDQGDMPEGGEDDLDGLLEGLDHVSLRQSLPNIIGF